MAISNIDGGGRTKSLAREKMRKTKKKRYDRDKKDISISKLEKMLMYIIQ